MLYKAWCSHYKRLLFISWEWSPCINCGRVHVQTICVKPRIWNLNFQMKKLNQQDFFTIIFDKIVKYFSFLYGRVINNQLVLTNLDISQNLVFRLEPMWTQSVSYQPSLVGKRNKSWWNLLTVCQWPWLERETARRSQCRSAWIWTRGWLEGKGSLRTRLQQGNLRICIGLLK